MLFELGGRRKRVIQVIYVFLALLLGVGALGLTDSGSSGSSQFDQQIDNANENLDANPDNTQALLTLARYQYLKGQQSLETDDQGNVSISDDSISAWQDATDAWERYLDALPK